MKFVRRINFVRCFNFETRIKRISMSSLYENDTDSIYEADSRHGFFSEKDVVNETSVEEIPVDGPKEYPPIVTLVYHVSIMLFAPVLVICLQLLTASDCTSSTKKSRIPLAAYTITGEYSIHSLVWHSVFFHTSFHYFLRNLY